MFPFSPPYLCSLPRENKQVALLLHVVPGRTRDLAAAVCWLFPEKIPVPAPGERSGRGRGRQTKREIWKLRLSMSKTGIYLCVMPSRVGRARRHGRRGRTEEREGIIAQRLQIPASCRGTRDNAFCDLQQKGLRAERGSSSPCWTNRVGRRCWR